MRSEADGRAAEEQEYEGGPQQTSPELKTDVTTLPPSEVAEASAQRDTAAAAPTILDLKTACGFTSISEEPKSKSGIEQVPDLSTDKLPLNESEGLNERQEGAEDLIELGKDQMMGFAPDAVRGVPTASDQNGVHSETETGRLDNDADMEEATNAEAPSRSGKEGAVVADKVSPKQPAAEQSLQDIQAM